MTPYSHCYYVRPCPYCKVLLYDASECEKHHRDDARVYNLAVSITTTKSNRAATTENVHRWLSVADKIVDDFITTPDYWLVRSQRVLSRDSLQEVLHKLLINGYIYVVLKDATVMRYQALLARRHTTGSNT
jgi:hypothetical protein